ncbi:hypothetical protein QR680_000692 [Steinernema hermaphroditum]|uniref:Acetyl-coenzyme A carboxylase carboxyl transferase subunit beta domain-containing protein n=1 Tax=Steinernema hermaphroditum TaxID=289476 RepID=A0AA39LE29_9BILA|nr:hypothetical protein QR680_000692 [Steinernema hermaphroditum]
MKPFAPDKPAGRTVIVVASDISFRSSSYSMDEHNLYAKASVYSRKINCARVFIAALCRWPKTYNWTSSLVRSPRSCCCCSNAYCEVVVLGGPATPNSQANVVMQASQLWYLDSAYKTAKAINDFNREGFPLVILAEDSLEDLSGGQKDVFDMVLK